ncbi:MAG TPA: YtxH domain-containing protein [Agromyces sp.]|jgi:hypothetical protein|nr:YtxH domain-containing protein [Agromyces sp.]
MKGKILFVVGLGVGYVLGARAGRERYEQIRKAAEDVWNQPKVQEGVQTVKDFAMSRAGDVGETVLDGAKKLVSQVSKSQTSSTKGSSGSSRSAGSGANGSPGVKPTASASRPSTSSAKTATGAKSTGTSSSSSSSPSNSSSS